MKTLPLLAAAVAFWSGIALAADEKSAWMTDYEAAVAEAKATGKPVLADFTGSDWCGWCIKLSKETFDQPKFLEYAKDHLVLLELDYPNGKEQSEAVNKQNAELSEKFKIQGFPTLVLIDGDGKEIARHVGYLAGGPDAMIEWIKKSTEG